MNVMKSAVYETVVKNSETGVKSINHISGYVFAIDGICYGVSNRDVTNRRFKTFKTTELSTGALIGKDFKTITEVKEWTPDAELIEKIKTFLANKKTDKHYNGWIIDELMKDDDGEETADDNIIDFPTEGVAETDPDSVEVSVEEIKEPVPVVGDNIITDVPF